MKTLSIKAVSVFIIICVFCCTAIGTKAVSEEALNQKLDSTAEYLLSCPTPQVGSIGGEWAVIGLARAGKITDEIADGYYSNVIEYVRKIGSAKLHRSKSTENSRLILALTSIGKDVTNVAGYNLLEPLADFDFVKKQGINGPVWALIAFDSMWYEIPDAGGEKTQTTRELLVEYILNRQTPDGGWSISEDGTDPDMTAMAIQALAPYYADNKKVKSAVDAALTVLSETQALNGGFNDYGDSNPESCAQVITALASLGINPYTDARFMKNGKSVLDAMMAFSVNNGFEHIKGSGLNQMSTEQSFYALAAYSRLQNGKTPLYDMTDLLPDCDVNLDGKVNIDDATDIQKYLAEIKRLPLRQIKIADADKNGKVEISDVTYIQKLIAEL